MTGSARKKRVPLPKSLSAQVLFDSDRTCCVCRQRGKPIQIHHIDEDPSNNAISNLSVLCLECHELTQISGGFGRKLDADQVMLYRDQWTASISTLRGRPDSNPVEQRDLGVEIRLATNIAESFKENEEWALLAGHYDGIGNYELRDKYIEKALESPDIDPDGVVFLRGGLQHRPDLIPPETAQAAVDSLAHDPLQQARVLTSLGRPIEALTAYLRGILETLAEGRPFPAAYYLKEACDERFDQELFKVALDQFASEGDLWWQNRCYDELGWTKERIQFLLRNADTIEASGNLLLLRDLAWARQDPNSYVELATEVADGQRTVHSDVILTKVFRDSPPEDAGGGTPDPS